MERGCETQVRGMSSRNDSREGAGKTTGNIAGLLRLMQDRCSGKTRLWRGTETHKHRRETPLGLSSSAFLTAFP